MSLPENLKILGLWRNELWKKLTIEELKIAFCELPKDLNNLDLSINDLWEKSNEELKELFSILPKDLKILHLWNNNLSISQMYHIRKAVNWNRIYNWVKGKKINAVKIVF